MNEPIESLFQEIKVDLSAGVLRLTLNRPHARNATTPTMFDEIDAVLERVERDDSIKVLVITGAGEDFCIGSDLAFLKKRFSAPGLAMFRDYLVRISGLFDRLERAPVPTLAVVNGRARAGGFELILACDFVVVAESAKIGDVHTPYGHMPGAGATQRCPRKIGYQKALELILTGRWLTGREAVEYGIALKAVPLMELEREAQKLIGALTDKTRESMRHIKTCFRRGLDLPLSDGIRLEVQSYLEYLSTSPEPLHIFWDRQNGSAHGSNTPKRPAPGQIAVRHEQNP